MKRKQKIVIVHYRQLFWCAIQYKGVFGQNDLYDAQKRR